MSRRNKYGKDMDLQNEATARYRRRQREQKAWVNEIAEHLGVDSCTLISNSAQAVAELIRAQGTQ